MKTSEIQDDDKNFGFAAFLPDMAVETSLLSRIIAAL
jgi:hypothetical protein